MSKERERIEVYSVWDRDEQPASSVRCPICSDFPIPRQARYTRDDGRVWLCELCWERVFGDGDE